MCIAAISCSGRSKSGSTPSMRSRGSAELVLRVADLVPIADSKRQSQFIPLPRLSIRQSSRQHGSPSPREPRHLDAPTPYPATSCEIAPDRACKLLTLIAIIVDLEVR